MFGRHEQNLPTADLLPFDDMKGLLNPTGDAGEMGLDCTIFRADGAPLGDREAVVKILKRHFYGAEFGWAPSGIDKLAAMKSQGFEPPESLKEFFLNEPAKYEGICEGSGWFVQFFFGNADPIIKIDVVLRGDTKAGEVMDELVSKTGWLVSYP